MPGKEVVRYRPEGQVVPERVAGPTHIIRARRPEGKARLDFTVTKDQRAVMDVLSDAAHFPEGHTPRVYRLGAGAGNAEVFHILQECKKDRTGVVARGGGTSLTGAVVPRGEAVIDMSLQRRFETDPDTKVVTAQPGVTFKELNKQLRLDGLFFPSSPTWEFATVGGAVNTDAGGPRVGKYGKTRKHVEGVTLVTTGGIMDINRGEYIAHPPDAEHKFSYFEFVTVDGDQRIIPVPTYQQPKVPKVSAGYYPGTDLLDLVIGSEGTLGVITDVRLKAREEPPTAIVLIPCPSEEKALELTDALRDLGSENRESLKPGGVSAIEYIGPSTVELLREHGTVKPPEGAHVILVAQVELANYKPEDPDMTELLQLNALCKAAEINTRGIQVGMPDSSEDKERILELRENAPLTANSRVKDKGSTKVQADPCVAPKDLQTMMDIYKGLFDKAGMEYYIWGHAEDANMHVSAIPDPDQIQAAQEIIRQGGLQVIRELHGTGMAEHGVGKNPVKQKLLLAMFGEEGIAQMRAVKRAFDPDGIMAPGNISPLL